jgi:hypothetical protein
MKRQAPDSVVSAPRPVEAAKEWAANVVPGITSIPSGIWEVNRAREAGYTYFAAADDYGLDRLVTQQIWCEGVSIRSGARGA